MSSKFRCLFNPRIQIDVNRNILPSFSVTVKHQQCLRQNNKRTFVETSMTKLQKNLFDTSLFVQKLESEGFTRQQSEAIMNSLSEVIDESMQYLTRNMVTKADQEKALYTTKVDFAQLKSEIQMLEKNDFSILKSDNEKLVAEVEKLKQRLGEEIKRTQASTRLELNLEKGRIRDESSMLEMKLKETDTRFESEISNLRTQMESIKFQTLQYMIGKYSTLTGAGALILAYLRMFR
ncbi:12792_t:CDS:2 [Acaulospora morrowiae]|uniref:12792_t:CDS:1 n=1 Tax=Acaulospora morrowiae TaxID=94023 RepID=A0A9N9CAK8_9GLOM|nr:12792_t:CDS:2 [Acaulospora morrowiae]